MEGLTYEPLGDIHAEGLLPVWSDEDVIRYTNIAAPCTKEEVEKRIALLKGSDVFAVMRDAAVIGIVGCPCINREKQQFGFFYQFGKSVWGKGIATAAAQWLLDIMTQKYPSPTLYADVVADNIASEKILKRLGFNMISQEPFEKNGVKLMIHNYMK